MDEAVAADREMAVMSTRGYDAQEREGNPGRRPDPRSPRTRWGVLWIPPAPPSYQFLRLRVIAWLVIPGMIKRHEAVAAIAELADREALCRALEKVSSELDLL